MKAKVWIFLGAVGIGSVVTLALLAQPDAAYSPVRLGYAGLSLLDSNAVLFTLTNQNAFPIQFDVFTQTSFGWFADKTPGASGSAHPNCTYTFHVTCPSTNRWRVTGWYYVPGTTPVRRWAGGMLTKIGLRRMGTRLLNSAPIRVELPEMDMAGDRPQTVL